MEVCEWYSCGDMAAYGTALLYDTLVSTLGTLYYIHGSIFSPRAAHVPINGYARPLPSKPAKAIANIAIIVQPPIAALRTKDLRCLFYI